MKITIKVFLISLIFTALLTSFGYKGTVKRHDFSKYVNPFIGTGGHGHTFPGATLPFGMVQLSPDTKIDNWDHCSGYHFGDSVILGFSHTHLSGTGIGDYGDIRFMPFTGKVSIEPGNYANPDKGYASRFSHKNEIAVPGYYSVFLDDYGIEVDLTATERAGMQRYTFPESKNSHVIIDLKEAVTTEKILDAEITVVNDSTITGFRKTKGWAANHYVYFYSVFSKPFKNAVIYHNGKKIEGNTAHGGSIKVVVDYKTAADEKISVKTGISAVDVKGAENNLKSEIKDWNFDKVKKSAGEIWNTALSKIEIEGGSDDQKTIFYTALYHTMMAPNIYWDADNRYRGHDNKIHAGKMYTVFSIWDTFRALHPLFTIIERKRDGEFIKAMLDMYNYDKHLPVWELAANETWCMIGYNSVSVIADAYRKGIRDFDAGEALKAMVETANSDRFGLKYYKAKGYVPSDKESESVSKTLEYSYDDWCIAQMAAMMGEKDVYNTFIQRGQYYKNLFDKKTGFFRAKANGCFLKPFDPRQVNFNFTEANAWQYSFFVPQDMNTLIDLLGGDEKFSAKLDKLFTTAPEVTGRHQADITGLIGQYAHGNEPSHHVAYLYNFSGDAWKTQKTVNKIMYEMYKNAPGGLAGNEDCGQMSAWYVMSAMGFYSVTPGSNQYVLGSPLFDKITVNLENGKRFTVTVKNRTKDNCYIKDFIINGKNVKRSYITHEEIMNGSDFEFVMASVPDKNFGKNKNDRPFEKITENLITPVPYFEARNKTFKTTLTVKLDDLFDGVEIFYKKDGGDWKKYKKPLVINKTTGFEAKAVMKGKESFVETARFVRVSDDVKIKLLTKYDPQYTAGGDDALINTIRGGNDFKTGNWQGYNGNDLEAVIDFGKKRMFSKVGIGFLQDENSWIFMPLRVSLEISDDGKHFVELGEIKNNISPKESGVIVKDFVFKDINKEARYIRIKAKNRGVCPEWHKGYPGKAWIFADEIWFE